MTAEASRAALIALAALPAMTPRRLRIILQHHSAIEALDRLRRGAAFAPEVEPNDLREMFAALRTQAKAVDPARVLEECAAQQVEVVTKYDPSYPAVLADDPFPPAVIFVRGRLDVLAARRVAIVGTRNATAAGRATAFELGEALAANRVAVVSGLARGIDGAAHRGVRAGDGQAIGIVGNGLDCPYPKQNADIWQWVAEHGLLVSEWAPGSPPDDFHFPLRNRIIAALAEVLVVVESRQRGGSLITAKAATDRGVTVMAVPGSTRNPACEGTNRLLVEFAPPVTCVDDILVALGLDHSRDLGRAALVGPDDAMSRDVLDRCAARPHTLDMIAQQLGVSVSDAAVAVSRLEQLGLVVDSGGWFESTQSKLSGPKLMGSKAGLS
jgi:DNA processing protein